MAEIEFTIPTVQYGNVKVRMTPEELYELSEGGISLYDVGAKAMEFLSLVTQGFEAAKSIDFTPQNVTGQYQESPEETTDLGSYNFDGPGDVEAAAEDAIKSLGATTVEPWTINPPKKSAKDWETFDV